jgi:hypothetical protein
MYTLLKLCNTETIKKKIIKMFNSSTSSPNHQLLQEGSNQAQKEPLKKNNRKIMESCLYNILYLNNIFL